MDRRKWLAVFIACCLVMLAGACPSAAKETGKVRLLDYWFEVHEGSDTVYLYIATSDRVDFQLDKWNYADCLLIYSNDLDFDSMNPCGCGYGEECRQCLTLKYKCDHSQSFDCHKTADSPDTDTDPDVGRLVHRCQTAMTEQGPGILVHFHEIFTTETNTAKSPINRMGIQLAEVQGDSESQYLYQVRIPPKEVEAKPGPVLVLSEDMTPSGMGDIVCERIELHYINPTDARNILTNMLKHMPELMGAKLHFMDGNSLCVSPPPVPPTPIKPRDLTSADALCAWLTRHYHECYKLTPEEFKVVYGYDQEKLFELLKCNKNDTCSCIIADPDSLYYQIQLLTEDVWNDKDELESWLNDTKYKLDFVCLGPKKNCGGTRIPYDPDNPREISDDQFISFFGVSKQDVTDRIRNLPFAVIADRIDREVFAKFGPIVRFGDFQNFIGFLFKLSDDDDDISDTDIYEYLDTRNYYEYEVEIDKNQTDREAGTPDAEEPTSTNPEQKNTKSYKQLLLPFEDTSPRSSDSRDYSIYSRDALLTIPNPQGIPPITPFMLPIGMPKKPTRLSITAISVDIDVKQETPSSTSATPPTDDEDAVPGARRRPDIFKHDLSISSQYAFTVITTRTGLRRLKALLEIIDVPAKRIQLKVRVAEIDETAQKELGLQLGPKALKASWTEQARADDTIEAFSFGDAYRDDPLKFNATLNSLISDQHVEILAEPVLSTVENVDAVYRAIRSVPFQQATYDGDQNLVTTSFAEKEVGIELRFKPRLGRNDYVTIELMPRLTSMVDSSIDFDQTTMSLRAPPVILERSIASIISVKSGEPFFIAGMIDEKTYFDVDKVPLLSEIPLLGNLFKYRHKETERSEVVIIVIPEILEDEYESTDCIWEVSGGHKVGGG